MGRNKRYNVTLPWGVGEALERWAASEGNKPTTLASYLVESAVRKAVDEGLVDGTAQRMGVLIGVIMRMVEKEFVSDSELAEAEHDSGIPLETLIKLRNCLVNGDSNKERDSVYHS
jgi:hypothetical protein